MTVQDAIANRRSIRRYLPDAVPASDLQLILEAGRLAPSGCNAQPWRFVVVRDPALREQLAQEAMSLQGNTVMCREAPVIIACLAVVDAHCEIPERVLELSDVSPDFANPTIAKRTGRVMKSRFEGMPVEQRAAYMALNTAIALSHMMLQATALGYGTCWLGAFDQSVVRRLLEVPPGLNIVALTPLGRPAEDPRPRPRTPLCELVSDNHYGAPLEL